MVAEYIDTRDIPLADLSPFPGNARRGDTPKIRESLKANGQYRALVVRDTGDRLVILAGNHTRDALAEEGHQAARCEVIRCDDQTAARINLVDNRTGEIGGYDDEALALLLAPFEVDPVGTGWTDAEIAALLHPDAEDDIPFRGDPDSVPDPPAEPVSKLGDLWLLGPHRLACGDSLNPLDVDRTLEGLGEPGIVYTDPPYGISVVGGDGKVGDGIGAPFRGVTGSGKVIPTTGYLPVAGDGSPEVAADAFRLAISAYPAARHIWWGANHYAATAGLPDGSCWLVWDKETNGDFADAELAWTSHSGSVRLLRHMWNGMLRASERGKRFHPTQKPVALAEWAFEQVDPKTERRVVLDLFGGSGSTLIAAHRTGRVAALIELEPAYVDVICRRFQEASGEVPALVQPDGSSTPHDFLADAFVVDLDDDGSGLGGFGPRDPTPLAVGGT